MNFKVCVVGLGYVGLPLSMELAKLYNTVGYDIDDNRTAELKTEIDRTREIDFKEFKNKPFFTSCLDDLAACNFFIVTVPTPVNSDKTPDLNPLISVSKTLGKIIKKGDIIVYESTVYPGCTEEICLPILEKESGLKLNVDFSIGYSPERINPGDKVNNVRNIQKVISGSNFDATNAIEKVYASVVDAGLYRASSIKVAEASKIIENCQRDINIGFINSLVPLFHELGISTHEVIEAASTKWNFLKFTPGLVGGHCIGVDPYYLVHLANKKKISLNMIEAARDANEDLATYLPSIVLEEFLKLKRNPLKEKIVLYGAAFKENCPDIRNSKSMDLYTELKDRWSMNVELVDPVVNNHEVSDVYGINVQREIPTDTTCILVLVPHDELTAELDTLYIKHKNEIILLDVKGTLNSNVMSGMKVLKL